MTTNNSYARWQIILIKQLGFTTNLIFSVNLVILGFLSSLIIDDDFILCNGKMLFTSGYIILSFCFVTGVLINISRLYDFRLTAKIARIREKDSNDEKLSSLRERTERLGKLT